MRLSRAPVIFRFLILFGISCILLGIPLGLLFGLNGLVIALIGGDLILTWAAFQCEAGMIRGMRAHISPSPGLFNSLEDLLIELRRESESADEVQTPRLAIFPDPIPKVLSVRGLSRAGTILLSSGVLTHLNEAELRVVLKMSILRLQEPEWIFYSLCSNLLIWVLRFAPRPWVDLYFSTAPLVGTRKAALENLAHPFSAVRFILLLPWIRLLLRMGCPTPMIYPSEPAWPTCHDAIRKLRSFPQDQQHLECPAASPLLLANWFFLSQCEK